MSLTESPNLPLRPAWMEIDLAALQRNLEILRADMPPGLKWCSVVKDQAYGHGAVEIAKATARAGASMLAVATLEEAIELQDAGIATSVMNFGERPHAELEPCIQRGFIIFVNDAIQAREVDEICHRAGKRGRIHLEIDSGLSRYGIRWTKALPAVESVLSCKNLELEGIMTHFAMSDELDKTFANEQLARFNSVLSALQERGIRIPLRHTCNSGGYLDLPHAHLDMVRVGILPLGAYPSKVCRRIPGLEPIMAVKTRVAALQQIESGDHVGYGMRYTAAESRTIAVLPIGYGDGFPRVRNTGFVLIHGQRAAVVGGNAMDAMIVDVSAIPGVKQWNEVVLVGKQGGESVSVHDLAAWGGTVSYDVMTKLSIRLPRVYL